MGVIIFFVCRICRICPVLCDLEKVCAIRKLSDVRKLEHVPFHAHSVLFSENHKNDAPWLPVALMSVKTGPF